MRILGIDPGSTSMGFAVIEQKPGSLQSLTYGTTDIKKAGGLPAKLVEIKRVLLELIEEHSPDAAGIERLFFSKNKKTAFEVAQARGVILLTLQECSIPIIELTPGEIKLAVTNYGAADKAMVRKMVMLLLNLKTLSADDNASDALATAIAAANNKTNKKISTLG